MARAAVLGALMLAAFTFNTAENLLIGLLQLISESLRVSLSAVGLLVTGYGLTVAVASLTSRGVRTSRGDVSPEPSGLPAVGHRCSH